MQSPYDIDSVSGPNPVFATSSFGVNPNGDQTNGVETTRRLRKQA